MSMKVSTSGAVSLKVMAERHVEGVSKVTKFAIDPRIVEIEEGFNVRDIDRAHVESLKASVRAGRVLPDIDVRVEGGRIILIDGHHRLTAYLELITEGLNIVSVGANHFRGNDADRVLHMLTTAQGLPLTPLQQGISYLRLLAFGWSVSDISVKTGKSGTHIHSCLTLAESNTDVQRMVKAKEVSAHVAVAAVRKHGSNAGEVLSGHLNEARMQGKSKVTAKTVVGASPKSLIAAIRKDMESGGSFKAEELCPAYADLIAYLRNATCQA
jgi:hypothetical protein